MEPAADTARTADPALWPATVDPVALKEFYAHETELCNLLRKYRPSNQRDQRDATARNALASQTARDHVTIEKLRVLVKPSAEEFLAKCILPDEPFVLHDSVVTKEKELWSASTIEKAAGAYEHRVRDLVREGDVRMNIGVFLEKHIIRDELDVDRDQLYYLTDLQALDYAPDLYDDIDLPDYLRDDHPDNLMSTSPRHTHVVHVGGRLTFSGLQTNPGGTWSWHFNAGPAARAFLIFGANQGATLREYTAMRDLLIRRPPFYVPLEVFIKQRIMPRMAIIQPGELIVIPGSCAYQVLNYGENISMSGAFLPFQKALGALEQLRRDRLLVRGGTSATSVKKLVWNYVIRLLKRGNEIFAPGKDHSGGCTLQLPGGRRRAGSDGGESSSPSSPGPLTSPRANTGESAPPLLSPTGTGGTFTAAMVLAGMFGGPEEQEKAKNMQAKARAAAAAAALDPSGPRGDGSPVLGGGTGSDRPAPPPMPGSKPLVVGSVVRLTAPPSASDGGVLLPEDVLVDPGDHAPATPAGLVAAAAPTAPPARPPGAAGAGPGGARPSLEIKLPPSAGDGVAAGGPAASAEIVEVIVSPSVSEREPASAKSATKEKGPEKGHGEEVKEEKMDEEKLPFAFADGPLVPGGSTFVMKGPHGTPLSPNAAPMPAPGSILSPTSSTATGPKAERDEAHGHEKEGDPSTPPPIAAENEPAVRRELLERLRALLRAFFHMLEEEQTLEGKPRLVPDWEDHKLTPKLSQQSLAQWVKRSRSGDEVLYINRIICDCCESEIFNVHVHCDHCAPDEDISNLPSTRAAAAAIDEGNDEGIISGDYCMPCFESAALDARTRAKMPTKHLAWHQGEYRERIRHARMREVARDLLALKDALERNAAVGAVGPFNSRAWEPFQGEARPHREPLAPPPLLAQPGPRHLATGPGMAPPAGAGGFERSRAPPAPALAREDSKYQAFNALRRVLRNHPKVKADMKRYCKGKPRGVDSLKKSELIELAVELGIDLAPFDAYVNSGRAPEAAAPAPALAHEDPRVSPADHEAAAKRRKLPAGGYAAMAAGGPAGEKAKRRRDYDEQLGELRRLLAGHPSVRSAGTAGADAATAALANKPRGVYSMSKHELIDLATHLGIDLTPFDAFVHAGRRGFEGDVGVIIDDIEGPDSGDEVLGWDDDEGPDAGAALSDGDADYVDEPRRKRRQASRPRHLDDSYVDDFEAPIPRPVSKRRTEGAYGMDPALPAAPAAPAPPLATLPASIFAEMELGQALVAAINRNELCARIRDHEAYRSDRSRFLGGNAKAINNLPNARLIEIATELSIDVPVLPGFSSLPGAANLPITYHGPAPAAPAPGPAPAGASGPAPVARGPSPIPRAPSRGPSPAAYPAVPAPGGGPGPAGPGRSGAPTPPRGTGDPILDLKLLYDETRELHAATGKFKQGAHRRFESTLLKVPLYANSTRRFVSDGERADGIRLQRYVEIAGEVLRAARDEGWREPVGPVEPMATPPREGYERRTSIGFDGDEEMEPHAPPAALHAPAHGHGKPPAAPRLSSGSVGGGGSPFADSKRAARQGAEGHPTSPEELRAAYAEVRKFIDVGASFPKGFPMQFYSVIKKHPLFNIHTMVRPGGARPPLGARRVRGAAERVPNLPMPRLVEIAEELMQVDGGGPSGVGPAPPRPPPASGRRSPSALHHAQRLPSAPAPLPHSGPSASAPGPAFAPAPSSHPAPGFASAPALPPAAQSPAAPAAPAPAQAHAAAPPSGPPLAGPPPAGPPQ